MKPSHRGALSVKQSARRTLGLLAALLLAAPGAGAAAPASAPQVLLAITNSESMDGTTAGAIMVGSGIYGASLATSSSPVSYTVPAGFTPPLNAGSAGSAPYTVQCGGGYMCDNGPSRLNMTKAAISNVLSTYGNSMNFGVYTFSTGAPSLYTTWVYYMSGSGGFAFTNSASSSSVSNPCYQYSSATSDVQSGCSSFASLYGAGAMSGNPYLSLGATSDNALINDVLYASSLPSVFLTYGTVSPANPYTFYSLQTYNTNIGGYAVSYAKTSFGGGWATTPTNAGYVPSSPQVLYSLRGFGYGASQSATTGNAAVPMSTDPAGSVFAAALAPETNNPNSSEIKSVAGQSGIYGLLNGARSYMSGFTRATCQAQYVVLLTDGLPTMDSMGYAWPPLGTTTANAYGLTASFNGDGSLASTNSQALTDAVSAAAALYASGIKVFVIGLGAGVDPAVNPMAANVLKALAVAGGTLSYYSAADSNSLNNAFLSIAGAIYRESSVAAPVAPISVAGGTSFEYELTSFTAPAAGHVRAYPVTPAGVPATTASWDAAALMTTSTRATSLLAAKADGTITTLGSVDAAAFNLTPTTCVPNTATVVNYTINPSYKYGSCSYLAGRDPSSLLGPLGTQNTGLYVSAPGSSYLTQKYGSYVGYARSPGARAPMVVFSDQDGFIYAVDAASGALKWGWTSRNILAQLQNYSTLLTSGTTNGGFAVVDAMDANSTWGAYLIGSLQSGAEHFSVKLDSTGKPATMVFDATVASGWAAGDKAGTTGSAPLRQPPLVAYIGNSAYYVYVITVGSTSTLYETNVASGTTTSVPLGFQVSATLALTQSTNQLWIGGADGTVRMTTLTSGSASTDIALLQTIGTTVNPSTGSTLGKVLYVGYTEAGGVPYVYALNSSQLTVFGVTSAGWAPLWASTPSAGYAYNGTAWSTSNTVTTLNAGAVVSDVPLVVGSSLLVPVYVQGSGCSAGTGYYDFFSFADGTFPTKLPLTRSGQPISSDLYVGLGPAYTPSLTRLSGGIGASPGSGGSTAPQTPLVGTGALGARSISWRRQ